MQLLCLLHVLLYTGVIWTPRHSVTPRSIVGQTAEFSEAGAMPGLHLSQTAQTSRSVLLAY